MAAFEWDENGKPIRIYGIGGATTGPKQFQVSPESVERGEDADRMEHVTKKNLPPTMWTKLKKAMGTPSGPEWGNNQLSYEGAKENYQRVMSEPEADPDRQEAARSMLEQATKQERFRKMTEAGPSPKK